MLAAEESSTMSAEENLERPESTVLAANRCEQRDNRGDFAGRERDKHAHRAELVWPMTSIFALCMTANARCPG